MMEDHAAAQEKHIPSGYPLQIPVDDGSDEPVSETSDAKSTPTTEGGSSLTYCFESMMDGVMVNLAKDSPCCVLVGFLRGSWCRVSALLDKYSSLVPSQVTFATLQSEIMSFKGGEWVGRQEKVQCLL